MMVRRPRAPTLSLNARSATVRHAPGVTSSRVPHSLNSLRYCLISAWRGSTRMRARSADVSGCSAATTGKRPTNSGMSPYCTRSAAVTSIATRRLTSSRPSASSALCLAANGAPMPAEDARVRRCTMRSSPTNAPPTMKRMDDVSSTTSERRSRDDLSLLMVTMSPSTILSSACCTPSPPTSRWLSAYRASLSTSSMYTIPRSARCTSPSAASSRRSRQLSTSSPT
mmetsp:Transcript_16035/g.49849  ORF Transcript_16035/g.49849 Transcript_16035/m.49849 type:complete len:226 (-) Transcript_16035:975-1652(-)